MVSFRSAALLLLASVGLHAQQACTGLCLQQVQCPAGSSTTVTGTVYAPNGVDPIPNVTVYIPNAPVDPLPAGIVCPAPGQLPSGSPLVGAFTAADGTFTLPNVPVGSNIPIVILAGKWRRQLIIPGTVACTNTAFNARFPRNQGEGDIPKFAVSTGNLDQVECVLRKVGVDDAEFTNPGGTGRIQLFQAVNGPGARIDINTPKASALMGDSPTLNSYDVLMLPCEGSASTQPAAQLANLVTYANGGGRVYGSHYAYEWLAQNPPFDTVANWTGNTASYNDLIPLSATVDPTFPGGATLSKWLQLVGASTTPGKINVSVVRKDFSSVKAPTQSWLTLDQTGATIQFTFATPVAQTSGQCGRVLFNEYHVENPVSAPKNKNFPTECPTGDMSPQEKLLEYSLFDLANNGGPATMTPASADFGNQAVGYTTASQTFTIRNNSVFSAALTSSGVTGDFLLTGNTCASVVAGGTCSLQVAFRPTDIGPRTGALNVTFGGTDLTAALTGNGIPPLSVSATSLDFGNVDVTASASRVLTLTNAAPGTLPLPALSVTGDFRVTPSCPPVLSIGASCPVTVTFTPTATGVRTGTLSATGISVALTGNGVDFALAMSPDSGTVIAGLSKTPSVTISPIAGFASAVTLTCSTDAPASTCTLANSAFTPVSPVTVVVTITTTSQYKLIGYGVSSNLLLALASVGASLLLYRRRLGTRSAMMTVAAVFLTSAAALSVTGCSGKQPAQNPAYTPVGTYTYTVSATDGILTRSATYKLTITAR